MNLKTAYVQVEISLNANGDKTAWRNASGPLALGEAFLEEKDLRSRASD